MRGAVIQIAVLALLSFASVDRSNAAGFVDESNLRGVQVYDQAPLMGGGVAVADFDDDGDPDLFVPNREGTADQVYLNDGTGQFNESASLLGLASISRSRSALWFDADGDRDLDLLVGSDCFGFQVECRAGDSGLRLYRQETTGAFTEVTADFGLHEDMATFGPFQHRAGLAAADFDGDGDLDVYTGIWDSAMPESRGAASGSAQSRLYRNDLGTFVDVTAATGLSLPGYVGVWQPIWLDLDDDTRPDLLLSVDFGPNRLYRNNGLGGFTDISLTSGFAFAASDPGTDGGNDMGLAPGDVDNDGDVDLYATNIWNYNYPGEHNPLFVNQTSGANVHFADVSQGSPIANTDWGWGAAFLDYDGDGDLDLAATNGFSEPTYLQDQSRFFRNDGFPIGGFVDVSVAVGFDDTLWGSALAAADLDRDGRIDLVHTTKQHPGVGPLRLLMNRETADMRWLRVIPRMSEGPNHQAIGATVSIETSSGPQMRSILAGQGFLAQEPAEALFGMGTSDQATVVVEWPDGSRSVPRRVSANGPVTVFDSDGLVDGFE